MTEEELTSEEKSFIKDMEVWKKRFQNIINGIDKMIKEVENK